MIGQTLSHFQIVAKLGEGGMGEVYRAEDTRLGRDVAIKVLPQAFTADSERLARFEREAKVLAALNHQNIAGIHEVGTATPRAEDGTAGGGEPVSYLVMEHVPGEDLADRLERGAMAVDEAVPIAMQVAGALEAAHERGIVHRDLKPANVKLTPDGRVKVLDFGLARALDEGEDRSPDLSMSPTLTAQMTEAGVILGTAAYMSPEQARGKAVDERTDIWSFGVLLYEMLTGTRGYEGETVTDLIASIVTKDPDWDRLPEEVSPRLRDLLAWCLEKDPMQRLRDIGDARIELGRIERQPAVEASAAAAGGRAPGRILPWAVAALATILAVVTLTSRSPTTLSDREGARYLSLVLPETQKVEQYQTMGLSPDGREVVYVARENDVLRLYRRPLSASAPLPIAGSEGGQRPFFSPDGRSVGFEGPNGLRVVPLEGGGSRNLCACPATYGATWSSGGAIVFTPRWNTGLWSVPAAATNAEPQELTALDADRGDVTHVFPQALPDGERVLFTIWTSAGPKAAIASIAAGDVTVIHEGGMTYRYAESGHLLFGQGSSLQAMPFDLDKLESTGQPMQIATGVYGQPVDGYSAFEVSSSGLLAYRPGKLGQQAQIFWSDRRGSMRPALDVVGSFSGVALSPDGTRAALQQPALNGPLQILVVDLEGGLRTQLTSTGDNIRPVFSPDGRSVIFSRVGINGYELLEAPIDGGSAPKPFSPGEAQLAHARATDFSRDGRFLLVDVRHPITGDEIFVLDVEGTDPPRRLVEAPQGQTRVAESSPDGRWVVYVSDATGRNELYLMPFNAPGGSSQITSHGGVAPHWNPTGNGEIFYFADGKFMHLKLDLEGAPRISQPPQVLFEWSGREPNAEGHEYSVAPDGNSFLFIKPLIPGPEANQIHLVLDLFEELGDT